MRKVKLAIIGCGIIGMAHIKNILEGKTPEVEIAAAADSLAEKREQASKILGGNIQVYDDIDSLLKDSNIEAVLIAAPHYFHPEIAVKAFQNGLHVLCEKPAGVYTKQVREMNEAAQKSGKVFSIMYNQRTNSRYKKIYELVKDGSLSSIIRTSWIITNWFRSQAYYKEGGWKGTWDGEGGGVLLNQCPHQLDLFQWICGMPDKVRAFCHNGKWHDIEVEDDVTAYLEYPNGATGTFVTSTGESPGTNRLEISLEKGKIVLDSQDNEVKVYRLETSLREFSQNSKEFFTSPKCTLEKPEIDDDNTQHAGIINSFASCILRGEKLIAPGCEGINGLLLSNAMHLSSWLEKTVEIPFDEDLFLSELNKRRHHA